MKNNEVIRAKQKIDKVFAKIDQLPKEDIELQAHWAKYLCICIKVNIIIHLRGL